MSKYFNSKYDSLEVYTPGEQPKDKKYIKLNTNESPFPPHISVADSLVKWGRYATEREAIDDLRLYCDPECTVLCETLAFQYGTMKENVYVANGSDDILNFAFAAFGEDGVLCPEISYGFYSVFAKYNGIDYKSVPLNEDFTINPEDYCNAGRMVCIANPNAPTGLMLSNEDIEKIVESNKEHVVLIDEAYIDFGGHSCMPLIDKYDNLLVVGTFSKSRSMAGARLGFAFAARGLIEDLETLKYSTNPYNVNSMTQLCGIATLKAQGYYDENCEKIVEAREYTKNELSKIGCVFTDSMANFVFVKVPGFDGEYIYRQLRERGILVRHFSNEKIKDYNRVTVGKMSDMKKFIAALRDIMALEENGGGILSKIKNIIGD